MSRKTLVFLGMVVGSLIGSYIPTLFGSSDIFSFSSVIGSAIGGLLGVFLAYKLTEGF